MWHWGDRDTFFSRRDGTSPAEWVECRPLSARLRSAPEFNLAKKDACWTCRVCLLSLYSQSPLRCARETSRLHAPLHVMESRGWSGLGGACRAMTACAWSLQPFAAPLARAKGTLQCMVDTRIANCRVGKVHGVAPWILCSTPSPYLQQIANLVPCLCPHTALVLHCGAQAGSCARRVARPAISLSRQAQLDVPQPFVLFPQFSWYPGRSFFLRGALTDLAACYVCEGDSLCDVDKNVVVVSD